MFQALLKCEQFFKFVDFYSTSILKKKTAHRVPERTHWENSMVFGQAIGNDLLSILGIVAQEANLHSPKLLAQHTDTSFSCGDKRKLWKSNLTHPSQNMGTSRRMITSVLELPCFVSVKIHPDLKNIYYRMKMIAQKGMGARETQGWTHHRSQESGHMGSAYHRDLHGGQG